MQGAEMVLSPRALTKPHPGLGEIFPMPQVVPTDQTFIVRSAFLARSDLVGA